MNPQITPFFTKTILVGVLLLNGASSLPGMKDIRNREPTWSPDNAKIAFVSNRDGNPEIYIMDADGGNQRNMTNSPAMDIGLAWANDGKKLAFVSNKGGKKDIYLLSVNSGEVTRLTNHGDVLTTPAAWSPDDSKIVFAAGSHRNADLYIVNLNTNQEVRLTKDDVLNAMPSWSPDG